jgi:dimethylaniline monooxygenase (N-oxide forming)
MIVNDDLIPELRAGRIISTHSIRRICGPRSIEFEDGAKLDDVDTIILATGYAMTFTVIKSAITYSTPSVPSPKIDSQRNLYPQPDLYQNIFPVDYADSMAVLNFCIVQDNASTTRELISMAVAQIWKGNSALPSKEGMRQAIDEHHVWFAHKSRKSFVTQWDGLIAPDPFFRFIDAAAGTGVYQHLGFSFEAFKFLLSEPKLYFLMAWGVSSPHIYRFFDSGKRKPWPGAREAILHVNRQSDINVAKKKNCKWD